MNTQPLILHSREQAVLIAALRRYEANEVMSGDVDRARIAERLIQTIREGEAIQPIAEIPMVSQ